MDALPMIAGAVLLTAGTIFAITIGVASNSDEETREHQAGS